MFLFYEAAFLSFLRLIISPVEFIKSLFPQTNTTGLYPHSLHISYNLFNSLLFLNLFCSSLPTHISKILRSVFLLNCIIYLLKTILAKSKLFMQSFGTISFQTPLFKPISVTYCHKNFCENSRKNPARCKA